MLKRLAQPTFSDFQRSLRSRVAGYPKARDLLELVTGGVQDAGQSAQSLQRVAFRQQRIAVDRSSAHEDGQQLGIAQAMNAERQKARTRGFIWRQVEGLGGAQVRTVDRAAGHAAFLR
jgi:hypothetical protein